MFCLTDWPFRIGYESFEECPANGGISNAENDSDLAMTLTRNQAMGSWPTFVQPVHSLESTFLRIGKTTEISRISVE
jgi:hypothetical protein